MHAQGSGYKCYRIILGTIHIHCLNKEECKRERQTFFVVLPKDRSNMQGVWTPIAIMLGARHNHVGKCMLVIMASPR